LVQKEPVAKAECSDTAAVNKTETAILLNGVLQEDTWSILCYQVTSLQN